jgi:hypothetical protein
MKLNKVFSVTAAALISAAPAFAGFNEGDAVTLGGQPAFHVAAADGMSAEHRAWVTQDRLDNALFLSANPTPSSVQVCRRNGALVIEVAGRSVVTADASSARSEGLSPSALADKWAGSIKDFLADSDRSSAYIASLKRPNALAADVAVVERRLYAPAGTELPITLKTALNSQSCHDGDRIEGVVNRDVTLGNYAIPTGSLVIGEVIERKTGEYGVVLNTLKLASGTELPISATVMDTYTVASSGAHPVCTMGMPANERLGCRVPATIGIGTVGENGTTTLALRSDTSRVIAVGQPFTVRLDSVTPVAVITRDHAM